MVMSHAPAADIEIGETELKRLLTAERPTILDVRERNEFKLGHHEGAVNIPDDELAMRFLEIDRARSVVIDCSRADTNLCHHAARTLLAGARFARVFVFLP
jgi:rhodanese-related sulfurtransferase